LQKRHDLLSILISLFSPVEDTLVNISSYWLYQADPLHTTRTQILEFPMPTEVVPAVFAVLEAKKAKKYQEENLDLVGLSNPATRTSLPPPLTTSTRRDCMLFL